LNRTRLIIRLNLDSVLKSTLSSRLFYALTTIVFIEVTVILYKQS